MSSIDGFLNKNIYFLRTNVRMYLLCNINWIFLVKKKKTTNFSNNYEMTSSNKISQCKLKCDWSKCLTVFFNESVEKKRFFLIASLGERNTHHNGIEFSSFIWILIKTRMKIVCIFSSILYPTSNFNIRFPVLSIIL